tara:strand:+ start:4814 stop:5287 length:474 start_codon:yes stop_codon:yes gene_type:complete
MNWFAILKQFDLEHNKGRLEGLKKQFSNSEKGIGYLPIVWSTGIEEEIEQFAQESGMQYKVFESQGKSGKANGNSFANGGHFMWKESMVLKMVDLINDTLGETIFNSVDELIEFVATKPYWKKPYRNIIDHLFGVPNIKLTVERREEEHRNRQRGFE